MPILPDGPESFDDLYRICDEDAPYAHVFRPSPADCEGMGIDVARLSIPLPFDEVYCRRLVATFAANPSLCTTIRKIVMGGMA